MKIQCYSVVCDQDELGWLRYRFDIHDLVESYWVLVEHCGNEGRAFGRLRYLRVNFWLIDSLAAFDDRLPYMMSLHRFIIMLSYSLNPIHFYGRQFANFRVRGIELGQ